MSEYQYYQFLAVERPLSEHQQGRLRALTSRAQITANRMLNHYEWGDFKGNPTTLVERYFDAHLYFSNWGSRRLLLRVPAARVALETVLPYCHEDTLSAHRSGAHVIIDMTSETDMTNEDEEEWWVREADWDDEDDHGTLGELVGVRDELSRGDMRPLALARLASDTAGPPGRTKNTPDDLTGPQQALAAFLRVTG